ncbi:MAG TPA: hypothetical protein VFJ52_00290 [Terriglobia bacterium]|nr:hypothetical protein [Terriglobia bacterium]
MAVVRTVLPRKGIIEPQHGANYETDLDTNWQIIDSLLQDANDVQTALQSAPTVTAWVSDRGLSGVVSGFTLTTSATLAPGLSAGALYAQGLRYAPSTAPALAAAPASSTSYLFYNSTGGFYYNLTGAASASGDAFIGIVATNATAVTSVTQATKIWGSLTVAPGVAGNISVPHLLGRTPVGALIQMTASGAIWFQSSTMYDGTNLYLVASDPTVTAKVVIW